MSDRITAEQSGPYGVGPSGTNVVRRDANGEIVEGMAGRGPGVTSGEWCRRLNAAYRLGAEQYAQQRVDEAVAKLRAPVVPAKPLAHGDLIGHAAALVRLSHDAEGLTAVERDDIRARCVRIRTGADQLTAVIVAYEKTDALIDRDCDTCRLEAEGLRATIAQLTRELTEAREQIDAANVLIGGGK